MNLLPISVLSVASLLMCLGPPAFATKALTGNIDAVISIQTTLTEKKQLSWRRACAALGQHLKVGSGVGGSGIFDRVKCVELSGAKQQVPPASWAIEIVETPPSARIVVNPPTQWSGWSGSKVTELPLPGGVDVVELLTNQDFAGLAAYALLDSMPALGRLKADKSGQYSMPQKIKKRRWRWSAPGQRAVVAYTLAPGQSGPWFSADSLDATGDHPVPDDFELGDDCSGLAAWSIDSVSTSDSETQRPLVFFHNPEGRGRYRKVLVAKLETAAKDLTQAKSLKNPKMVCLPDAKAGATLQAVEIPSRPPWSVVAHLGTSTVVAPVILQQSKYISLSASYQLSSWVGLDVLYGMIPQVSDVETGQTLESDLFSLGIPFFFDVPSWRFSPVDSVSPKVSFQYSSIEAKLLDDDGQLANLSARSLSGTSLRLSIIRYRTPLAFEVFAERSIALPLASKALGPKSVSTTQWGGDLEVWRFGAAAKAVGLRLFYRTEETAFDDLPDAEGELRQAQLKLAYAGLSVHMGF